MKKYKVEIEENTNIKFGYYAILIFVTMLINSVLFLGVICLIPSIEFGFSAFITGAFTNAIPGIILQVIIVPIIVMITEKLNVFKQNNK